MFLIENEMKIKVYFWKYKFDLIGSFHFFFFCECDFFQKRDNKVRRLLCQ